MKVIFFYGFEISNQLISCDIYSQRYSSLNFYYCLDQEIIKIARDAIKEKIVGNIVKEIYVKEKIINFVVK